MRVPRMLISAGLVTSASLLIWNVFLDERARANVKTASTKIVGLIGTLAEKYMNPVGLNREEDSEASKRNRDWVAWQWKQAGF